MLYNLNYSGIEQNLKKFAKQDNIEIEAINNKPVLDFGLDFYLDCFYELVNDRQIVSTGVSCILQPIPWLTIANYVEYNNIINKDDFIYFIRLLDNAYIKNYMSKQ